MNPSFHTVSDGRRDVVFCPATMTALTIDRATRRALDLCRRGSSHSSACAAASADVRRVEGVLARLNSPPDAGTAVPEDGAPTSEPADDRLAGRRAPRLERLVLNVSSRCNLRCVYCYAAGGDYGQPACSMSREIALGAVRWAASAFSAVDSVQFFGGEPLLSPRRIVEVCEVFRTFHDMDLISELPRFGLVTNGTLPDPRLPRMLEHYDVGATVSIDGPAEIHDALRGEGSFARTDRFVRRSLEEGKLRIDFECTWTALHRQRGCSIVDLVEFFHQRYGTTVLHVVPVAAPPSSPMFIPPEVIQEEFEASALFAVATLALGRPRSDSFSYRVMEALEKRRAIEQYCPAGLGTLAVAADGGLYPCFMLVGKPGLRIGRITAAGRLVDDRRSEVSAALAGCLKGTRPCCRECWAAPFCAGCIGGDLIETGDLCRPARCDMIRTIARTILLEVATARVDDAAPEAGPRPAREPLGPRLRSPVPRPRRRT